MRIRNALLVSYNSFSHSAQTEQPQRPERQNSKTAIVQSYFVPFQNERTVPVRRQAEAEDTVGARAGLTSQQPQNNAIVRAKEASSE